MKKICLMFLFISAALWSAGCGSNTESKVLDSLDSQVSQDYPNAGLLVSGNWLSNNISSSNLVIIDTRSSANYTTGHIPGAISLPVGTFDAGGNPYSYALQPVEDVAAILGNAGVSNTAKIIVYGANVDPSAGRVFWILEYLGADDVHILDGGYAKWAADGRANATDSTTLTATTFTNDVDAAKLATKAEVLVLYPYTKYFAIVDSRNATVDINASLLAYDKGHIPGAINIAYNEFLNSDFSVKSYSDIRTFLDGKGVTADKTVICHCYFGYRSGYHYFIFRLMGFDVRHYAGSWVNWTADLSGPIEID